ncbi:MAG: RDD family protein [Chthonomonas sp.]|nr:RDD family protein [Chthonomonas sp.]
MKDIAPVLTPEKVVVTYRIAGLNTRFAAQILDWGIVFMSLYVLTIIVGIASIAMQEVAWGAFMVFAAVFPFLYFIALEGLWNGQTLGKKALRLRVVMIDGTPVSFFASLFRNLLRPADMIPGVPFVGLVSMFATPRFQRIGDLAVGTIVIHEPMIGMRFTPAPYKYGIHPLEHHIGSLRQMQMSDYLVMKRLCDRFPYLTKETQARLTTDIWAPFAAKHKIDVPGVHPVYLMEAVVMKYGRQQELV